MLTVSEDEDELLAAMNAGASGYVLKGVSARDLASVVRSVSSGEVYVVAFMTNILTKLQGMRVVLPKVAVQGR
jgi:DNA-binding NarL/FixJ family response regulator